MRRFCAAGHTAPASARQLACALWPYIATPAHLPTRRDRQPPVSRVLWGEGLQPPQGWAAGVRGAADLKGGLELQRGASRAGRPCATGCAHAAGCLCARPAELQPGLMVRPRPILSRACRPRAKLLPPLVCSSAAARGAHCGHAGDAGRCHCDGVRPPGGSTPLCASSGGPDVQQTTANDAH